MIGPTDIIEITRTQRDAALNEAANQAALCRTLERENSALRMQLERYKAHPKEEATGDDTAR